MVGLTLMMILLIAYLRDLLNGKFVAMKKKILNDGIEEKEI